MTLQQAAEAAYVLGWRQNDSGGWYHPEYDRDDPPFDSPLQVCAFEKAFLDDNGTWRAGRKSPAAD